MIPHTALGPVAAPACTLIELCDLHSDRPSLRDRFPPGSEFVGEPLPDSSL